MKFNQKKLKTEYFKLKLRSCFVIRKENIFKFMNSPIKIYEYLNYLFLFVIFLECGLSLYLVTSRLHFKSILTK